MAVPSGNSTFLTTSDLCIQLTVPYGDYVVMAVSDTHNKLAIPSRNCAVLDASLPGSSPRKLHNRCQVIHHET